MSSLPSTPAASPTRTRRRLNLSRNLSRRSHRGSLDGAYTPASAHDDLSRHLDPLYTSSACSTPRRSAGSLPGVGADFGSAGGCSSSMSTRRASWQAQAYVDPAGELHDPDFRAFPLLTQPSPRRASADYSVSSSLWAAPAPSWERTPVHAPRYPSRYAAAPLDDDEPGSYSDGAIAAPPRDAWAARREAKSATQRVLGAAGGYPYPGYPYAPSSYTGMSPSTIGTSPESDRSDCDRPLRSANTYWLNDHDDERQPDHYADGTERDGMEWAASVSASPVERWKSRRRKLRKMSAAEALQRDLDAAEDAAAAEETELASVDATAAPASKEEGVPSVHEETHSCSYAIRRQYQALVFRVRLTVFRTKRRFKHSLQLRRHNSAD